VGSQLLPVSWLGMDRERVMGCGLRWLQLCCLHAPLSTPPALAQAWMPFCPSARCTLLSSVLFRMQHHPSERQVTCHVQLQPVSCLHSCPHCPFSQYGSCFFISFLYKLIRPPTHLLNASFLLHLSHQHTQGATFSCLQK
jgi:hypothetical protein